METRTPEAPVVRYYVREPVFPEAEFRPFRLYAGGESQSADDKLVAELHVDEDRANEIAEALNAAPKLLADLRIAYELASTYAEEWTAEERAAYSRIGAFLESGS